jgi:DNA-binding Lrp family transcriptional regulator
MTTQPQVPLDRRIIGALQVDGRASWRQIAAVLDLPERTVARHGSRLLEEGTVVVTGLASRSRVGAGEPLVLRARCRPGTARVAASAIAQRRDSIFSYVVSGPCDVVGELTCPEERLASVLVDELPSIPGIAELSTSPVLRYYRTVHDWMPGLLTEAEHGALAREVPDIAPSDAGAPVRLGSVDRVVLRALAEDGRRTSEELARLAGVSDATARRRVDALRAAGLVYFRAVVEPASIGLPVEALLWIRVAPHRLEALGSALAGVPYVRYAAALAGEFPLVVDLTVATTAALHEVLTTAPWLGPVESVEISTTVESFKRSAVLAPRLRTQEP